MQSKTTRNNKVERRTSKKLLSIIYSSGVKNFIAIFLSSPLLIFYFISSRASLLRSVACEKKNSSLQYSFWRTSFRTMVPLKTSDFVLLLELELGKFRRTIREMKQRRYRKNSNWYIRTHIGIIFKNLVF